MKNVLHISLRPGERIYVNGAVLKVDRKVSIEFLNDVTFLLEQHVLLPDDAYGGTVRLARRVHEPVGVQEGEKDRGERGHQHTGRRKRARRFIIRANITIPPMTSPPNAMKRTRSSPT